MERFEHGGDIYAHPGVLDFSASLNPLGMPARAIEALRQGVERFASYPDPQSQELTAAVATFEGVGEEQILMCAGATDALARLCQVVHPAQALLCAPCYVGYEQALQQVGAGIRFHLLREEEGFALTQSVVEAIDEHVQLVFLANPNNPTGRCIERNVLLQCLERASAVGALVILDECFIDLTDQRGSNDLLASYDNLVIVKAFTKSFALAGLRLGYALSSNLRLLADMRAAGQPWAVSVPAQLAGVASVAEEGYLERSRVYIAHERARLQAALEGLGMRVVPSDANYLLFSGDTSLFASLLARGILIRSCENFVGLGPGWYRIAVRTSQENDCLIQALREVVTRS